MDELSLLQQNIKEIQSLLAKLKANSRTLNAQSKRSRGVSIASSGLTKQLLGSITNKVTSNAENFFDGGSLFSGDDMGGGFRLSQGQLLSGFASLISRAMDRYN